MIHPSIVLQYISTEDGIPNQYIPYLPEDTSSGIGDIREYLKNGNDPHLLGIFINPSDDGLAEQIEKTAIETIGKRIYIYAINDYVLYAAGI